MPSFQVVMRHANLEPFEGTVSAATIDAAMILAEQMGHTVDREATLKLAAQEADHPGVTANAVAILLALAGWLLPEIGLAAIVCAVIAIERSSRRRGYPALILSLIATAVAVALRLKAR